MNEGGKDAQERKHTDELVFLERPSLLWHELQHPESTSMRVARIALA